LKTAQTARNFKKSIGSSNEWWQLQTTEQNLERMAENSNSPNKTSNERWKLELTEQNLKGTAENGCTSTQPRGNYKNLKSSNCGWGQVLHGPTVGA